MGNLICCYLNLNICLYKTALEIKQIKPMSTCEGKAIRPDCYVTICTNVSKDLIPGVFSVIKPSA